MTGPQSHVNFWEALWNIPRTFENKRENYFSTSLCPLLFKIVHIWASCVYAFVVPSLRHILISATPSTAACQASLSFTVFQSLLKFMPVELVMLFNHLTLCHPLLLLPSIFPSIRVFSNESTLHIKCQSIGASALASVLPMNIQGWFPLGLTGLIYLLSKGLSKVFSNTTIRKHKFFGAQPALVQLSHLYMTTAKTIDLTIWTFVSKVMSAF